MRHASSSDVGERPAGPGEPAGPGADALADRATVLLSAPGLVVITGGPGSGRSTMLRRLAEAFRGPVFAGGGLAMLRAVPAFALARAVRVRLPTADTLLLAEAVRSRVRAGLLVLDDLQFADPATCAALPLLAAHCRVLVALRTPHRLTGTTVAALHATAAGWLTIPPLDFAAATALAGRAAPGLDAGALAEVVRRAGGVPLAVQTLARHAAAQHGGAQHPAVRHAAARRPPREAGVDDIDQVAYAVAGALSDLTRPARTAMAALGLLGRPATAALLGAGVAELLAAGLVVAAPAPGAMHGRPEPVDTGVVLTPVSPYVAEVAAGLLDADGRRALHRRLAGLVPAREAARHLAAAGDVAQAYACATGAAATVATTGERAELLQLACELPGHVPEPRIRVAAAAAALAAGRPRTAVRVLGPAAVEPHHAGPGVPAGRPGVTGSHGVDGPVAAVLRGEAMLHLGDVAAARAAVTPVADDADPVHVAGRDRILLLAGLAAAPGAVAAVATAIVARHGDEPAHAGLRAALAAVRAAGRVPGWEYALASAAGAAGAAGDALAARWSAWLLVETLAADGRLAEAADTAGRAAKACAADLAYSWQTRFLAADLWFTALRGSPDDGGADEGAPRDDVPAPGEVTADADRAAIGAVTGGAVAGGAAPGGAVAGHGIRRRADEVARRAGDLTDRSLPAQARGYATAAVSLVEADAGLLGPARARLAGLGGGPASVAPLLDWVGREAAWLDGQPDRALLNDPALNDPALNAATLVDGLRRITARWAAFDGPPDGAGGSRTPVRPAPTVGPVGGSDLPPVRQTLAAWAGADGDPRSFAAAATAWRDLAVREEVRCLLAGGLHATDPAHAVPSLLAAERLAERAGLVVLAGRARRALRRHAVRRDTRGPRAGDDLTVRERGVLRLVARGEPTRRIAGQLGISGETVETHIRSGMRKLGARTRTEAAALALEVLGDS